MPPRRRTAPSPIDVEDLRSRLDQGKIVRVAIAQSAQFPEGAVGRVRRLGDPDVDGDEFIHVELTVNGTKDLLPFAPTDLTAPTRVSAVKNGAAEPARASAPQAPPAPPGEPLIGPAGSAELTATGSGASTNGTARTNGSATHGTNGASTSNGATAPSGGHAPAVDRIFFGNAPEKPVVSDPPARAKATRATKPAAKRRGPMVAISIGTTDTDPPQWRLEAKVGAKVVVRNGSVPPARVWELVGMLGDETLSRAVGTVLDEQRQAAQSRADALAAELAAVQAELAELPEPTG